ncbi:unnamed protein product [Oppiella nova]|uniref:15-oxoprostaglandin 13-reductase n=1 Tax=Oppiella nova TaxID=334625 RepID=A0A7R9LIE0_9ACAR|nr:unnamed protein product [Oppiella nova]CAG2163978.1 unnamed protein product [Oppiella nova]
MTSSEEKAKLLKELGTDRVINYKTENLDEVLTKEFPKGVDVVWETIGGQVYETLFKHLAPKGRMVIVGGITGYKTDGMPDVTISNLPTKLLMGNQSLTGFLLTGYSDLFPIINFVNQLLQHSEAVQVVEVPLVPPTDDQVVLKVVFAGVNATDVNVTAGRVFSDQLQVPHDVGLEACNVKSGDKILITAPAGSVGHIAVQWAKHKGCYVIGMTSSEEKVKLLKELGTDRVINYKTENLDEVLTKEFPALGIIEAVGKDVKDLTVGQTVLYYANREDLTPVPSLKPELISLPVCGLTASIGLDEAAYIRRNDKVLVTAAAGGTGMMVVQWAKQKGCYVIGLTSTSEKAKLLKELGTDRVINYKTENLDEVLTKEFPEGVDVIWETIGGQVFETLFNHLAPKGRLVLIGGTSSYKGEATQTNIPDLTTRLIRGNQMLSGFFIWRNRELFPKYLPKLIENVVNNKLRVVLDLGQNTSEGEFVGIDSVVRGVEVSVIKTTCNFREAVRVVSVPLVKPSDDEILVKTIYAGVNATDVNITAARYFTDGKVPFDIGLEYAKPDEVIPVPSLKPEFISLLVCGLTAAIGLDELGRIKKGEKVLITASAGGTGHIAVQWAKQKGAYVIGLTSTPEKEKLLKELGTDRVINYKTENLDEVLTNEFPKGIDVVWETIGGQVYKTLFKHLAEGGRLIIVGGITGYKTEGSNFITDPNIPNLPTTLLMKNQTLSGFILSGYKHLFTEYFTKLVEDVVTNKLRIVLDFGIKSGDGEFNGIDSVVRGVEVMIII